MQGIYIIKCDQEDIVYIGSSTEIPNRWIRHRYELNKGIHHNNNLQLAWDAYGDESFSFEILEETVDIILAEQQWIDKYERLYNISKQANNPMANPKIATKVSKSLIRNRNKHNQKLQMEDVVLIKEALRDKTVSVKELSAIYNVSISTIYAIKRGERWSHVKIDGFEEGARTNYSHKMEKIISLYHQGLSVNAIAEECGMKSPSSVYDILKSNSIKPDRKHRAKPPNMKRKLTEEDVVSIKESLRDKTLTPKQLCEKYVCSRSLIQSIKTGERWGHVVVEGFIPGRKLKTTDFLPEIVELKAAGLTHNQIIEALGLSCRPNGITYALKKASKSKL